jgi:peptidoglycan/xylan/chitin deacetylase (PgdA/CDA1 family)
MSVKNISSAAASIIKLFILIILFSPNSKAQDDNIKYYSDDKGILTLMYHRFNEPKYPSTNIQMDIFKKQINIIDELKYKFYDPIEFEKNFFLPKKEKKILITIDDAFSSFYNNAWPFLKKKKIPFILFVSTEAVGKFGYMNWNQIKEIEKEKFAYIGNHSHSHDYLIEFNNKKFLNDINTSIEIFKNEIGYNPIYFSYPFGEYSEYIKNYIKKKFKFSFGQHSGIIDVNKDIFELPRFPINEKYGDLKRFKFLINLNTFQFKKLIPEDKYLSSKNNPPSFYVEFFNDQNNIKNTNCYSNEGNKWKKSKTFILDNILKIEFIEKFLPRRGRINCSLNDDGVWRWFGVQYSIKN